MWLLGGIVTIPPSSMLLRGEAVGLLDRIVSVGEKTRRIFSFLPSIVRQSTA